MEFKHNNQMVEVKVIQDNPHVIEIAVENYYKETTTTHEIVLSSMQMQELIDNLQERILESKINEKL